MPPVAYDLPPSLLLAKLEPTHSIVERLRRDEGLRLKLYRDTRGNWLIGYGRNLKGRGISSDEAMMLLQNDIVACQKDLDQHLPWWREHSDLRQMAMLSLCYNLGIYGLKDFKAAIGSMKAGNYRNAARQFRDSNWARQVGDRARRITHIIEHDAAPTEERDPPALSKPRRGPRRPRPR